MAEHLSSGPPLSSSAQTAISRYLTSNEIWVPRTAQFVFLCGKKLEAEQSGRRTLLEYAKRHLKFCRFFLAEEAIEALRETHGDLDMLQIEAQLAAYADSIILILESDGAKAELGAFAHDDALAEITLAINDKLYVDDTSFITEGPLRKLDRTSKLGPTIYTSFASISRSHDEIEKRLRSVQPKRRTRVRISSSEDLEELGPKTRALLVADLVWIASPLTYAELVRIVRDSLGEGDYSFLRLDLSILQSLHVIGAREEHGLEKLYLSNAGITPLCEYDKGDMVKLRSQVLASYARNSRERLRFLVERAGEM